METRRIVVRAVVHATLRWQQGQGTSLMPLVA